MMGKIKKNLGKAVVESVACYGSELWHLKREEQRKLLPIVMDYLSQLEGSDYKKKSQTPALGAKCKQNNQFFTEVKKSTEMVWTP